MEFKEVLLTSMISTLEPAAEVTFYRLLSSGVPHHLQVIGLPTRCASNIIAFFLESSIVLNFDSIARNLIRRRLIVKCSTTKSKHDEMVIPLWLCTNFHVRLDHQHSRSGLIKILWSYFVRTSTRRQERLDMQQ